MTTSACPDRTAWKALLRGQISPDEERRLQQHLDVCPQCQKALEMSAGSTTFLVDLAAKLQRTHSELSPELANLLDTADGEAAQVTQVDDRQPFVVDPTALLAPGQRPDVLGLIDSFEVLEVLGQGGMGVVFKARDPKLRRLVAIKVLSPFLLPDQTSRQRFLREARAAAAVNHPNAVTIYSVHDPADDSPNATTSRCPYLVMEFVDGPSLHRRIARNNPLSVGDVLRIAAHVAAALSAFHARGLVHRDVKPANILLDAKSGRAKLTDFGLTRGSDDVSLTKTGIVVGTPGFMSPEQAFGKPIDHRSDLFSLGSVMFAMLAGRPPFRDQDTLQTLLRLRSGPPPSIATIRDDLPAGLIRLIDRLHAVDPAARPQTAAEVLAELRHLRGSAADSAPLPSLTMPALRASPSDVPRRISEGASKHDRTPTLADVSAGIKSPATNTARQRLAGLLLAAFAMCLVVWTVGWFKTETPDALDAVESDHSRPASPTNVAAKVPSPFVLLDEDGRVGRSAASLSAAIEQAASRKRTRIRVTGDGPFLVAPISVRGQPLWIEAAESARPVFVFKRSPGSSAAMIDTDDSLTLTGIELQVGELTRTKTDAPPLIRADGAELELIHCSLRGSSTTSPLIRTASPRASIRHSLLFSGATTGVAWVASESGTLTLDNNVWSGFGAVVVESPSPPPLDAHVELTDNTFVSQFPVQIHFGKRQGATPFDRRQLRIAVERNQFRALQSVIAVAWSASADTMPKRPEQMLPLVVQWVRDIDNLYSLNSGANWISHRFPDTDWSAMSLSPRDLPIWINFWKNRSTATSRSAVLEFALSGLFDGTDSQRLDLTARDFRVPQIGRASNPPGADVGQVGPAPAK